MVCGDSCSVSVTTAQARTRCSEKYIKIVKNGMCEHAMEYLSTMELTTRGNHVNMVKKSDVFNSELMALLKIDRGRRYFIA